MHPADFKTQKRLREYTRQALRQRNWKFVEKLLPYHPELERKLKGPLLGFEYEGGCLYLLFGQCRESISWRAMVRGVFKSPEETRLSRYNHDLKQAARNEISHQVVPLRRKGMHVGHDYEKGQRFDELLRDFLQGQSCVILEKRGVWRFQDRCLAREWSKYHAAHALLRMETPEANLKGNRGFRKSNWSHRLCPPRSKGICRNRENHSY